MSEFYRTTYGSQRKRARSVWGSLLDIVMGVVTLAVVAMFITTLFVPRLDPREWGEITTLGLIAPFVFIAQTLMTIYWIARWRLWIAVPMVVVSLFGIFTLSTFYQAEIRRTYGEPVFERSAIKVMTYNVRSFIDDNGERSIDSMVKVINGIQPDILCLQEFGFRSALDTLLGSMKQLPATLSRKNLSPVIYSRFPIIRAERIDSVRNFLWADLLVRDDTVRVFNIHLHTTAIRRSDSKYIENREFIDDEESEEQLRDMVSRLSESNQLRATQADTIKQIISSSPYPVIVCGDFNDIPVSYTYRTIKRRLRDAFREQGRGYSYTYRGFFDMLRIDYIFTSKHFDVLSYDVVDSWGMELSKTRRGDTIIVQRYGNNLKLLGEGVSEKLDSQTRANYSIDSLRPDNRIEYSDHYPVLVRLRYNGKTN